METKELCEKVESINQELEIFNTKKLVRRK